MKRNIYDRGIFTCMFGYLWACTRTGRMQSFDQTFIRENKARKGIVLGVSRIKLEFYLIDPHFVMICLL